MKNLTVKEKLKLLVAEDGFSTRDLGGKVRKITVADGPSGLRTESEEYKTGEPAFCYPSAHVLANSWDTEAVKAVGRALASDCIDKGVDILLAPGINIKRNPLCGRNFEYFSEDPFLAGELAAEYVNGLQSLGVGACVKHFCANNREQDRLFKSSELDKRTLREIYAKAFEIVIKKSRPFSIMCSYNPVNGINAAENEWLLRGVLRNELGFDGVIVSDWEAVHDRSDALKASLDIEFPHRDFSDETLLSDYESGKITEKDADESLNRIFALLDKIENAEKLKTPLPAEERRRIALSAAEKGMVLLKNGDGLLPIKKRRISVFGEMSKIPVTSGGGAAMVNVKNEILPLADELKKLLPDAEINYLPLVWHHSSVITPARVTTMNLKGATDMAYDSDVAVIVAGNSAIDETECYDRETLRLSRAEEEAICALAEANPNTVVVLEAGSAVDVSAFADKVKAILFAGYAGETVNEAVAKILVGKVNPSGRLSETFPLKTEDIYAYNHCGNAFAERYSEGVMVGYRDYCTNKTPVAFPFGFGLSYSEFGYSDFKLEKLGNADYELSFTVKNLSDIYGGEVLQLYVKNFDMSVTRPEKELRRFGKVYLNGGEEKRVSFRLGEDCFSYFNECLNAWTLDKGRCEIQVAKDCLTPIYSEKVRIL